jgi:hypothetical protein
VVRAQPDDELPYLVPAEVGESCAALRAADDAGDVAVSLAVACQDEP